VSTVQAWGFRDSVLISRDVSRRCYQILGLGLVNFSVRCWLIIINTSRTK